MRLLSMLLIVGLLTQLISAAEVADMSGTWQLNVKRSKWGKRASPESVVLQIDHKEPKLKYTGKVTDAQGGVSTFSFDGAIDGKEYPVKEGDTERKITIKRLSPYTTTAEYKSADGKVNEVTTNTTSRDGKTLVRRVTRTDAEGKTTWTEAYDKQQ